MSMSQLPYHAEMTWQTDEGMMERRYRLGVSWVLGGRGEEDNEYITAI